MSQTKIIDNRGLSCPLPVVNTKKAMDELAVDKAEGFALISLVDNETAAENVSRFARSNGCQAVVEKKDDGIYIYISKSESTDSHQDHITKKPGNEAPECSCTPEAGAALETVMLITSDTLGRGNEELGRLLMRSFIFTLKEKDTPPRKLIFLNSGVKLTVEGSPVLEELQELAKRGVEIYSCGTCLDYYQLKEKLQIGQVTNMYDAVDTILGPFKCISV